MPQEQVNVKGTEVKRGRHHQRPKTQTKSRKAIAEDPKRPGANILLVAKNMVLKIVFRGKNLQEGVESFWSTIKAVLIDLFPTNTTDSQLKSFFEQFKDIVLGSVNFHCVKVFWWAG